MAVPPDPPGEPEPPDRPGTAARSQPPEPATDPRYLLANERTLLAWLRTAITFVAAGLAASEFLAPTTELPVRRLVGLPLIILGASAALAGYRRWRAADTALRTGALLPETRTPLLITAGVVAIAVVALLLALQLG